MLEQVAPWVAVHLSVVSGQVFTVPQLMGREQEDKANRMADAERSAKALEKRIAKAKSGSNGEGTWRAVE